MLPWLSLKPRLLFLGGIILILGILFGTHKVIVYKAVQKAKAETQATLQAQYNQKLLEASELARER